MNTNKAVYWIALAVTAWGLSSEYQHGGFASVHAFADHTETRLCRTVTHVQHVLLAAGMLTNHSQVSPTEESITEQTARIERAVALHQAELDRLMAERQAALERAQARMAQVQASLQRAGLRRVQVFQSSDFKMMNSANRRVITVCPQSGRQIRIEAGQGAEVEADLTDIGAGDRF